VVAGQRISQPFEVDLLWSLGAHPASVSLAPYRFPQASG
jgi:hypothetical protein